MKRAGPNRRRRHAHAPSERARCPPGPGCARGQAAWTPGPAGRSTSSTRWRVVAESAAATLVATRLPISGGTRPMIATTSEPRTSRPPRGWPGVSRLDQHPAQVEQQQRRLGGGLQEAVARDDPHDGGRDGADAGRARLAGQHGHLAERLARPEPREDGHLAGGALEEDLDQPGLDDEQRVAGLALADDHRVRRAAAPLEQLRRSRRRCSAGMPRKSGLASSAGRSRRWRASTSHDSARACAFSP